MAFFEKLKLNAQHRKESAIALLKQDHRTVKEMISEFLHPEHRGKRQSLLRGIIKELRVHSAVEEQLVYPLLDREIHEKTQEALQEHHLMELLLNELQDMSASAEDSLYKVKVLSEMVERHIEEEERTLLPHLRSCGADLYELGNQISVLKHQLMSSASKAASKKRVQTGAKDKVVPSKKSRMRKAG